MLSFRVDPSRMRVINKGSLKAFFDVDFGSLDEDGEFEHLMTVTDFALIGKRDGTSVFVESPYRTAMKDGQPIMDGQYPKKFYYVKKAFTETAGRETKSTPTKASYKLFDGIADAALKAFESKAGAQPTAPRAAGANVKASSLFAPAIAGEELGSPIDDDDDGFNF